MDGSNGLETPLKATIKTPISQDDPSKFKAEEIPLPPAELWADLSNSPADLPAAEPPAAPAPPPPAPVREAEELEFEGDSHRKVVTLKYPFKWDGEFVREVTVCRLRMVDVERFIAEMGTRTVTSFEIYAFMTKLPAKVLRGMIDEDGDAVTDTAFDFLPRAIREAFA